jgi:hypothetical protein
MKTRRDVFKMLVVAPLLGVKVGRLAQPDSPEEIARNKEILGRLVKFNEKVVELRTARKEADALWKQWRMCEDDLVVFNKCREASLRRAILESDILHMLED